MKKVGAAGKSCLIHVSGTLRGKFNRKQTGKSDWDEAKAAAAEWEKAGSWDGEIILPEPLPDPTQPSRVTIARAVRAFLDELQETAAFATHKKYRLLLTKFKEFSEKRGYAYALKAADAESLGGRPASAFMLATAQGEAPAPTTAKSGTNSADASAKKYGMLRWPLLPAVAPATSFPSGRAAQL